MAFTILIVDDSAVVRAAISKSLTLSDAPISELHEAGDGKEALSILKDTWIDLVLTDINMPVMDGVTMLKKMHEDKILGEIPVVVVSTEGSVERRDKLTEMGVRGFIRKPFTPESLSEMVQSVMGRGK